MMITPQESLWLKTFALGISTAQLLAKNNFTHDEAAKIEALLKRREMGEPLQYIMGEADFYGRDFIVGEGVLIPRHDTETLVEAVLKLLPREEMFSFIDWGTGSGCIAVTLLMEFRHAFAFMLETSTLAARYAALNLQRYNLMDRAVIISSAGCLPPCRLLISNPPYIPSREIDGLMKEVRDYEPKNALDGGEDGMKFYGEIFTLAERLGCEFVVLETGSINQVQSLRTLCDNFTCNDEILDGGGFPRCLTFRRRMNHEEAQG